MQKNCAAPEKQSSHATVTSHPVLSGTNAGTTFSFENDLELNRFMAANCSDAIYWMNPDGRIVYVNDQACRKLGYSRRELLAMTICNVDPNFQTDTWADHWEVIMHNKTLRLETVHRTRTGQIFPVEVIAGHTEVDGNPFSCMFARDMSEQRAIERKTRDFEIRLNRAQHMEALGTLAGGIAHDFNNILSSILGFSELSLDGIEPDSLLAGNIKEIFSAGLRARDLVKQILTFSRQCGQEKQPLQAKLIIKEALRLLRASMPAMVKIRSDINSNGLIMADPGQLHQIVMNLCTNANHAMQPDGGTLTVGLTEVALGPDYTETHPEVDPGRFMCLRIADSGRGIAPEMLQQIFEPFFTTKEPGEGTGMGLSVVSGIVREYGGSIHVESQFGQGTTFSVYFPLLEKLEETDIETIMDLPTGDERILLVDDEPSVSKVTAMMLGRLGYRVTHCNDSIEAYETFQLDPSIFDLVITDYTMPNLPGDKLSRLLMQASPDIPIILSTGYSNNMSAAKAREMGIKAFLIKPVDKKRLAQTVRSVLDDTDAPHTG